MQSAVGKLDCLQELDCQASPDMYCSQRKWHTVIKGTTIIIIICQGWQLPKRRWLVVWDMDKVWTFNINSNSLSFFMYCYRYANRPIMSVPGLYDPTEVMNATEMTRCQREGWIKLTFYLLSFFYYLYRWVSVMWLEMQVNR